MCFIELVDYNENMAKEKVAKKATRTRRSKKATTEAAAPAEAPVAEAPAVEEAKRKKLKLNKSTILFNIKAVSCERGGFFLAFGYFGRKEDISFLNIH